MMSVRQIVKHVRLILTYNLITVNEVTVWMRILIMLNCIAEPARKRIKVNHLMNVFDQVRAEIGAKSNLIQTVSQRCFGMDSE